MAVRLVDSLLKGLGVMEALARNPQGLALPDIVRETGLPKATAYRLLRTLVAGNYLHYFADSTRYLLGPKVMSLGMSALAGLDLASLAEPYLRALSRRIGQNVNLGILDRGEVVYIIRVKVRRILGIDLAVGSRLGAHNTAIGLALLAFMDPERLPAVIEPLGRDPRTAEEIGPGGQRLLDRLAWVRQRGYALLEDEYFVGLSSVAVPVFDRTGWAEGAINIPVFNQLCSRRELLGEYLPQALEAARTISELRGHAPAGPATSRGRG